MLDQIQKIIEQVSTQQAGTEGISSNLTSAITTETGNSIISGFKGALSGGNISQITDLFQGKTSGIASNPIVMGMITNLVSNLVSKVGLDSVISKNFASSVIPKVMETLVSQSKDSKNSGFQVTDLISSLSGGADAKGLLESLGGSIGLDKNKDGKLGLDDAVSAIKGLFK